MYVKQAAGYVVPAEKLGPSAEHTAYRVVKQGRVLTWKEETRLCKSSDVASFADQGYVYYQVVANPGACELCEAHNGAIYPIAAAKEGVNLPPFHPNCVCFAQEYGTSNPNHDPWQAEIAFWLEVMYGDGTPEEKAQGLLGFYQWTDVSAETAVELLLETEEISNVTERMAEFFRLLETRKTEQPPEGEEAFRLPGVHFEGKPSPLSPIDTTLPSEWTDYVDAVASMLDVDYYLVLAIILHESGGDPDALNTDAYDDPMQQASGLMQIIPYWHQFYQEGEQYYDNYTDVIEYAEEHGADINDIFDPLGNIAVGIMILNEQRKLCSDPTDMREWVNRYGQSGDVITTEMLYYRDLLAAQAGLETWYSDEYYNSLMQN